MTTENPMIVHPGQTLLFRYVGEQIPNQLLIGSTTKESGAMFNIGAGTTQGAPNPQDWTLWYMPVPGDQLLSLMVLFPTSVFWVKNTGKIPIAVGGDGIFRFDRSSDESGAA